MPSTDAGRPSAAETVKPKTAAARRQEARSRELRDRLFGNEFATAEDLAGALGWSLRTLARREAEGLPCITIEQTKLYQVAKVRDWIIAHTRTGPPSPTPRGVDHSPRRSGRPRRPEQPHD